MLTKQQQEQEILKEFEELGYEIERNIDISEIYLTNKKADCKIVINKFKKIYYVREFYTPEYQMLLLNEHQLLHRLFEIWGWFDVTKE
jgi:hypothetical protein